MKQVIARLKSLLWLSSLLSGTHVSSQIANYVTNGGFEKYTSCNVSNSLTTYVANAIGWDEIDMEMGSKWNHYCYGAIPFNGFRDNDADLLNFYNDLSGSNIDKFLQVEENIYYGFYDEAASILAEIDVSDDNILETNYKTFYTLYLSYLNLSAGEMYHADDGSSLHTLAELCPGTNGPVIYQAIALYNSIYGELISPDCNESEGRMANNSSQNEKNEISNKIWELYVFPNPASTKLNFTSNIENETLLLSILDLSGRIVFSGTVKTKDFIGKLDIDLINGAYFISIENSHNEKITKKLLIAK
jgi:hypothetical protein